MTGRRIHATGPRPASVARKDAALAAFVGELNRIETTHDTAPDWPDRAPVAVPIGWLRAARDALTAGEAE